MYREHLIESLFQATMLVHESANDLTKFDEFLVEYGNYYYYEALDGHEADQLQKTVLAEFSELVEFHARIQYDIVNLVYAGEIEFLTQYLDAGRITKQQGFERLQMFHTEYGIPEQLNRLEALKSELNGESG